MLGRHGAKRPTPRARPDRLTINPKLLATGHYYRHYVTVTKLAGAPGFWV
jgi:hypothetical protein